MYLSTPPAFLCLAVIWIACIRIQLVLCQDEKPITAEEFQAIESLRLQIGKYLYQDYMHDDHYLIRYLRAKNLNVQDAKEMLLQTFAWRKQNKIDTILGETLEIEKVITYDVFYDRHGRPAGSGIVGDYNIRKYLLAGKRDEGIRAVYKLAEFAMHKFREASLATGKNITQGIGIADVSGFNAREHACLQCIPIYLDLIKQYEKYYPQSAYKLIAVNTPRIAISLYETFKYIGSQDSINAISIYGYNKGEWREELLKMISEDQLPTYLGGTNVGDRFYAKK